ncbi:hypothetical protein [Maribacter arcticus]|uniref:hypothetical protein n=1 Tax=Maribacter arcticus TaxID=561365 RepID=UPI003002E87A
MKAIFTLLIIIFAGTLTMAQNPQSNDKVYIIEMGIVMVDSLNNTDHKKTFTISTKTEITRLYRYKNSRVNKELAFITQKSYGKLA